MIRWQEAILITVDIARPEYKGSDVKKSTDPMYENQL